MFSQIFCCRSWGATALPDMCHPPDSRLGEPCPLLEVCWLLASVLCADLLLHLQQHSNTNFTMDARRTISFLRTISQGLNLTWMELCDSPSHTPELCPEDAHGFFAMNIVSVLLYEARGWKDCSHGLLAGACATWQTQPWGKQATGAHRAAGTDTRVYCPLHDLVWVHTVQCKTNLVWSVCGFHTAWRSLF